MAITFPPTDDTTPDDGSVKYTDPNNGREYYWNGYAWELVCTGGGEYTGPTIIYNDTQPVEDPSEPFVDGSLWIRSTDLTLYVWADSLWAQVVN